MLIRVKSLPETCMNLPGLNDTTIYKYNLSDPITGGKKWGVTESHMTQPRYRSPLFSYP